LVRQQHGSRWIWERNKKIQLCRKKRKRRLLLLRQANLWSKLKLERNGLKQNTRKKKLQLKREREKGLRKKKKS